MDKIERIKKLSGVGTGIVWVVQIILAATIVISVVNWLTGAAPLEPRSIMAGVSSLVGIAGLLVLFFIILGLLGSLRKGRTPFEAENVRRLKQVALLLAVLSVLHFLTDLILSGTSTVVEPPDALGMAVIEQTVAFHSSALVMIVLGLIVYCVALAFQYGTELQQQSDETL